MTARSFRFRCARALAAAAPALLALSCATRPAPRPPLSTVDGVGLLPRASQLVHARGSPTTAVAWLDARLVDLGFGYALPVRTDPDLPDPEAGAARSTAPFAELPAASDDPGCTGEAEVVQVVSSRLGGRTMLRLQCYAVRVAPSREVPSECAREVVPACPAGGDAAVALLVRETIERQATMP